jgi:hypothetical protein
MKKVVWRSAVADRRLLVEICVLYTDEQRMKWFLTINLALLFAASGCGSGGAFNQAVTTTSYSGYIAASGNAVNLVALFNTTGAYVKTLRDLSNPGSDAPYGLVPSTVEGQLFVAVSGVSRIESINLSTAANTITVLNSNISANSIQGVALDASGNILVIKTGAFTVEKFTPSGFRVNAPFIPITVGGCTISGPRNIANLGNGTFAVTNLFNSQVNIYNNDGTCNGVAGAAPISANAPYAIALDSVHSKMILASNTTSAIMAANLDGSSPAIIYQNTTYIQNPTTVAVDATGNIYVGSTGQNTIEKLTFDGTIATRAALVPFIQANAYVRSPTGLAIIP